MGFMQGVQFHVGDIVQSTPGTSSKKYPGPYRVIEVPGGRRTKYLVECLKSGTKVSGHGYLFDKYTGDMSKIAALTNAPKVPLMGTVVTVQGIPSISSKNRYVVLGKGTKGGAKLCRLGGDDRYYRDVPAKNLVTVDLDNLA